MRVVVPTFVRLIGFVAALGASSAFGHTESNDRFKRSNLNAAEDSIRTVERARRDIAVFQQRWRDEWKRSLIEQDLGYVFTLQALVDDSTGNNTTPDLQRLRALSCYVGYLGIGLIFKERPTVFEDPRRRAPLPRRTATERIREIEANRLNLRPLDRTSGKRSDVSVCPQWIPHGVELRHDEDISLDHALTVRRRLAVRGARAVLIDSLQNASQRYPADSFLVGQLVRFLIDGEAYGAAVEAAEACKASSAWCFALQGFARTKRGDHAGAQSAFLQSLAMDESFQGVTCADSSVVWLFPESVALAQRERPCDEWVQLAGRMWWLADPLWSEAGNERFSQHYARRVSLALRTVADEDERYSWRRSGGGDGLREVISRYGWPTNTFWGGNAVDWQLSDIAADSFQLASEQPYTVKEYSRNRVSLIPPFALVENPLSADDSLWMWEPPQEQSKDTWWPPEHMRLDYSLNRIGSGQTVLLRRDTAVLFALSVHDSALVTAARAAPQTGTQARLVWSTGPSTARLAAVRSMPRAGPLIVSSLIPSDSALLSLEVPPRAYVHGAFRRRFAIAPPPTLRQMKVDEVAVSDPAFLVLPGAGAIVPATPDSALMLLAGSTTLASDQPVAIYWESYGFAPGDTLDVEVRIARRDGSRLRQLGAAIGVLSSQTDSLSIRWREPDDGRRTFLSNLSQPTSVRSVSLNLQSLIAGNYDFIVEMTRSDGSRARGVRRMQIVRPDTK